MMWNADVVPSSPQNTAHLVVVALISLAFGGLIYVVFRAPSDLYLFVDVTIPWQTLGTPTWAFWLGSVPTFCHALSFSLMTVAVLPRDARTMQLGCAFWALVDSAFEVWQWLPLCPTWLSNSNSATASAICAYSANGTFDQLDIASAWAGGLVAYMIARSVAFRVSRKAVIGRE